MVLDIVNLYKSFGDVQALNGMRFTVYRGRLFGFVGSNGAGKTTAMRIILGVLDADEGEPTLNGRGILFEDRRRFGYMPEERGLYPKMKVGDQLIYLARLHGLSHAEARENMLYWTQRLGLAHRRGDLVQALSLGNQQRVQLAAALVHNPDVLVLDEPFSGLDPIAVQEMSSVLREKADEGAVVLFSSHQLDLVERLCDEVAICSQGKIVASGTIDELRTTEEGVYDVTTGADASELLSYIQSPDSGLSQSLSQGLSSLGSQGVRAELRADILDPHRVRVTLPSGVTDQQLLHAALNVGAVHGFERYRPHLTELFSNVVTTASAEQEAKPVRTQRSGLFSKRPNRRSAKRFDAGNK